MFCSVQQMSSAYNLFNWPDKIDLIKIHKNQNICVNDEPYLLFFWKIHTSIFWAYLFLPTTPHKCFIFPSFKTYFLNIFCVLIDPMCRYIRHHLENLNIPSKISDCNLFSGWWVLTYTWNCRLFQRFQSQKCQIGHTVI